MIGQPYLPEPMTHKLSSIENSPPGKQQRFKSLTHKRDYANGDNIDDDNGVDDYEDFDDCHVTVQERFICR